MPLDQEIDKHKAIQVTQKLCILRRRTRRRKRKIKRADCWSLNSFSELLFNLNGQYIHWAWFCLLRTSDVCLRAASLNVTKTIFLGVLTYISSSILLAIRITNNCLVFMSHPPELISISNGTNKKQMTGESDQNNT